MSLHAFVAKCLEEIGLQGRDGISFRSLMDKIDTRNDLKFRESVWNILKRMNKQLYLYNASETVNSLGTSNKKRARQKRTRSIFESNAEEDSNGATKKKKSKKKKREENENDLVVVEQERHVLTETERVQVTFEEAMTNEHLRIVTCEELRLKYLGVDDPSRIDTSSDAFHLLEVIGKTRERGKNAAELGNSGRFGDARKLHYLLDILIGWKLVQKTMVMSDKKRFNIMHLTRFLPKFRPEMVAQDAIIQKAARDIPKEDLPDIIVHIMKSRGETSCVFADVGRELGFDKRQQEKIRKYFQHEFETCSDFPLELFLARCATGVNLPGRKLWCVRLRKLSDQSDDASGSRIAIEQGIMEQILSVIAERGEAGATVPEIRDALGVPSFKLPYRLVQILITHYDLRVEHVLVGKQTTYRMFACAEQACIGQAIDDNEPTSVEVAVNTRNEEVVAQDTPQKDTRPQKGTTPQKQSRPREEDSSPPPTSNVNSLESQRSSFKEAARNVLTTTTWDRRRDYILKRLQEEKIVPFYWVRLGLCAMEKEQAQAKGSFDNISTGGVDIRSVRRIIEDLQQNGVVTTMDITIPAKKALQKSLRVLKCIALPEAKRDKAVIKSFIRKYLEEHRKRSKEREDADTQEGFIVVSGKRLKNFESEKVQKEVVTYKAPVLSTSRITQANVYKQSKRLGFFFGFMYRCREFHILLWKHLRKRASKKSVPSSQDVVERTNANGPKKGSRKSRDIVFALRDFLQSLSLQDFLHLVGVSEVLSDSEESYVSLALRQKKSWEVLTGETTRKIRRYEVGRFSRLLRTLIELELLEVVEKTDKSATSAAHEQLLKAFTSAADFDEAVSQVASTALSGGVFKLKHHIRIAVQIQMDDKILDKLPTKDAYVYASNFPSKGELSGKIPLEFELKSEANAKEYWTTLQFLSLESGSIKWGQKKSDASNESYQSGSGTVRAKPLQDHQLRVFKVWIPKSTGLSDPNRARKDQVNAATASARLEKNASLNNLRKRSNAVRELMEGQRTKKKRKRTEEIQKEGGAGLPSSISLRRNAHGIAHFRSFHQSSKVSGRVGNWNAEDDFKLMELYLEKLTYCWFIPVPPALQKRDERVAFRTPDLSRTLITWKTIAQELKKRKNDCFLRVNELLQVPHFLFRLQMLKRTVIETNNPGGVFHEEKEIENSPMLVALLVRGLQIIFHSKSTYYSGLADMLISGWCEREIKLVWRYLWLGSVIATTKMVNEGKNQKQRGFCASSRLFSTRRLNIPHFEMQFFSKAAKYLAFLKENMQEEVEGSVEEHDLPQDASPSNMALELSLMTLELSTLVPEYVEPNLSERRTPRVESKKSSEVKGFTGHLAAHFKGSTPDDYLREYWFVKSHVKVETTDTLSAQLRAFSTDAASHQLRSKKRKRDESRFEALRNWILQALDKSESKGLSLNELAEDARLHNHDGEDFRSMISDILHPLVDTEQVYQVNAFDHTRFVLREHAAIWLVHPYRIETDSETKNIRFILDNSVSVVARPWLHLDGSVNSEVALALKRKVINIVMCHPGSSDVQVCKGLRRALTLQDTRCLLEELVEEEILYARLARKPSKFKNIFERSKRRKFAFVSSVSTGLGFVNHEEEQMYYFPSADCVQVFGNLICDAEFDSQSSAVAADSD